MRDHYEMYYHSAGMFEYHDGFREMLRKGHELRAPRAVHYELDPTDEDSVCRFLAANEVFSQDSEQLARERFHQLVHYSIAAAPKYADKGAVHFGAQVVLDSYYGGEKDNEIFVVYPSDFIASQYVFSFGGWEKDFTRPQSESKWNDVFVWDKERVNTSIPLDAGIVFLPRSTLVDRGSGSKYALVPRDDNRAGAFDLKRHDEFDKRVREWCQSRAPKSEFIRAVLSYRQHINEQSNVSSSERWGVYDQQSEHLLNEVTTAARKTLEELEVPPDLAESMMERLNQLGRNVARFHSPQEGEDGSPLIILSESEIDSLLRYTCKPTDPVKAHEFWESYFSHNPEQRPRHVVYYDGDPTRAVKDFLVDAGVTGFGARSPELRSLRGAQTSDDCLLGFEEHFVLDISEDVRANRGLSELTELGRQVIEREWAARHGGI